LPLKKVYLQFYDRPLSKHFYVWYMKWFCCTIIFTCMFFAGKAQTDTLAAKSAMPASKRDSVYMARLNSSGNLMIAGGIGLCGVGGYLIYEGVKVYNTAPAPNSTDPASDTERNHKQGTIYLACAGISIAGGVVLTAFGARNKVFFKQHQKLMSLQGGLLDNGNLGLALNF
jgi:hypothetical protein